MNLNIIEYVTESAECTAISWRIIKNGDKLAKVAAKLNIPD